MSTLDLNIIDIFHGDTPVVKVMKGDVRKWPKLPYDAEVEYLQTDGDAYIDTGVNTSSTTKFDIAMYLPASSATIFPFGARLNTSSSRIEFLIQSSDSRWMWRYGNKAANLSFGSSATSGDYTFSTVSAARTIAFSCGGTPHSISATANTFDTGKNFYLFCINNQGTPRETEAGIKLYSCKLYSGSTLVRDYISVRVGQVGYLYDKVTEALYGNANESGAFSFGNDK